MDVWFRDFGCRAHYVRRDEAYARGGWNGGVVNRVEGEVGKPGDAMVRGWSGSGAIDAGLVSAVPC